MIILHSIKVKLKDISYDFDRDLDKIYIFKNNLEYLLKRLLIIIDYININIDKYNKNDNIFKHSNDNILLNFIYKNYNYLSTEQNKKNFRNFKNIKQYYIDSFN